MSCVNWQSKRIGELTDLVTKGTTPTSVGYDFVDKGINFVKVETITAEGGVIDNKFGHITAECHSSLKRSQLKEGDILFSIAGALGRTAIVKKEILPANTNQALAIIRLKEDAGVLKEFLVKALETGIVTDQIQSNKGGVAQQNLSLAQVRDFKILIPPLPEQQRIVAILDQAFAAIDKAKANSEKNLQNIQTLYENYLDATFQRTDNDWKVNSIGEIAVIKGGKRVPKGYKLETKPTKHPYIRVSDFNENGTIDLTDIHYINNDVYETIKNYTISSNDLYISIAGTIGKTGIIPKELDGANLTENACKLVFNSGIDPRYILYFTKTGMFRIQAGLNTRKTAMPKLALTRLSTIRISIPNSILKQREIVQQIKIFSDEIEKCKRKVELKIQLIDELKKSILQKAFNGEL